MGVKMFKERTRCNYSCILFNGKEMKVTWTGKANVSSKVNGSFRNITLLDVRFAEELPWNFVSHEKLEVKGCQLNYLKDGYRVV